MKRRFVEALVRFYPARWRREYGAEFVDLVASRPLGAATVADVIWNAMRQQAAFGEPWILVGVPLLALNVVQYAMLILYPAPYESDSFSGGHWAAAVLAILMYAGVGYWTVMRNGPTAHAGRAAMKMSLMMNSPLCLLALLAGMGILRILVMGPGDAATSFHEHGFAMAYYDHARRAPSIFGIFLIPFIASIEPLAYGWMGGRVAKSVLKGRLLLHR
jgi:hypothetical protein